MNQNIPLNREFELMLGRLQRKRKGAQIPVISDRQYHRLRNRAKQYVVEICCAITFIALMLADTRLWVLLFIGAWGPVIFLWRWRNRDIAKGDEAVKERIAEMEAENEDAA